MDQMTELRNEIDAIDDKIMALLDQRYRLAAKIGALKQSQNKAIMDTTREQIILDKISNYSHSPQVEVVYKTIIEESRKLQRK